MKVPVKPPPLKSLPVIFELQQQVFLLPFTERFFFFSRCLDTLAEVRPFRSLLPA